MARDRDFVANQVFVGCPSKTVRPKYDRAIEALNKKYPLSFIIVGRNDDQDAEDLLKVIKERLSLSSVAVFDATGGNANVSLEYGLADAWGVTPVLYLSSHAGSSRAKGDSPIIADLAGKRRNHYKQERKLQELLGELAQKHNYTKRFEQFLRRKYRRTSSGTKKRFRALALKIIHALDGHDHVRRNDLVQELLGDYYLEYKRSEIDQVIRDLHKADLVLSESGRYSTLSIR